MRELVLRSIAVFALLFATSAAQELISLAAGAGCCQGEDCCDDEQQHAGLGGPRTCPACSHCGHASGVLPPPAPRPSRVPGPSFALQAWVDELALSEHRTPPFRPPAG